MKKLLFASVVCTFLFACGEKKVPASEVPQAVTSAFNAKYPNASGVEWEQEKENGKQIYEAEFKFNGKKIEAEFDTDGTFVKEEND